MSKRYAPSIGSVSSGTLRTEDLMSAFLDELCAVAPRKYGSLKRDARKWLARDEPDQDEGSDIVNELQDALDGCAPPLMYFGTLEGDGADFGWWQYWYQISELDQFDDTSKAAEARFVGEFKVVSDHGNVEVYVRFANGRIKNLLGVV